MNILEKRKYKRMIKDYENKGLSKYDVPGYKPVDMQDSIEWHTHILVSLKAKADAAEKQLHDYQQGLVDKIQHEKAEDKRPGNFGEHAQLASMIFLPEDDEQMKLLQTARNFTVGDAAGMEAKIARMKRNLALYGNVKLPK
jgi:hypothetical protein